MACRPPDPDINDPPPITQNPHQSVLQSQHTAAVNRIKSVNGTVHAESPHRRLPASGNNFENPNRQFESPPQQTPIPKFSGHFDGPSSSVDDFENREKSHRRETQLSGQILQIPIRPTDLASLQTLNPKVSDQPTNPPMICNDEKIGEISPPPRNQFSGQHQQLLHRPNCVEQPQTLIYEPPVNSDNPAVIHQLPNLSISQPTNGEDATAAKNKSNLHQKYSESLINQFPKVSTNFDRTIPLNNLDRQEGTITGTLLVRQNATTNARAPPTAANDPKNGTASVPPPPNIFPSYATRLKAARVNDDKGTEIKSPIVTTKQGLPAVLFNREDFMVKLASKCRFTLIGKFSSTMPKMEVIRKSLTSQLQIKGNCKVTHFNSTHVYIDLDNEIDHSTVWHKERIYIEGRLMRLLVWTPTFNPAQETTIAPVWVILPELPWHCYTMPFVTKLLEPIGRVLFFDAASIQKTRGSVVKVKVEIDITKPRPPHLWLGFPVEEGDVYGDGRWQELQFENIPEYCQHCKHQGHSEQQCRIKKREEEYQKRKKEQEEERKMQKNSTTEKDGIADQAKYQPDNVARSQNLVNNKDQNIEEQINQQAKLGAPGTSKEIDQGQTIRKKVTGTVKTIQQNKQIKHQEKSTHITQTHQVQLTTQPIFHHTVSTPNAEEPTNTLHCATQSSFPNPNTLHQTARISNIFQTINDPQEDPNNRPQQKQKAPNTNIPSTSTQSTNHDGFTTAGKFKNTASDQQPTAQSKSQDANLRENTAKIQTDAQKQVADLTQQQSYIIKGKAVASTPVQKRGKRSKKPKLSKRMKQAVNKQKEREEQFGTAQDFIRRIDCHGVIHDDEGYDLQLSEEDRDTGQGYQEYRQNTVTLKDFLNIQTFSGLEEYMPIQSEDEVRKGTYAEDTCSEKSEEEQQINNLIGAVGPPMTREDRTQLNRLSQQQGLSPRGIISPVPLATHSTSIRQGTPKSYPRKHRS